MNNADMPAMPCSTPNDPRAIAQARALGVQIPDFNAYQGLTKREMMAMHMMCSMNSSPSEKFRFHSATATAEWAVKFADILLAELERTKGGSK